MISIIRFIRQMDRIILEVFPTIIENGDMKDLIYFYDVNKTFRRLLDTPYILKQIPISFDCFDDVVNYYQIGLPAYEYLSKTDLWSMHFQTKLSTILVEKWEQGYNHCDYFYLDSQTNRICLRDGTINSIYIASIRICTRLMTGWALLSINKHLVIESSCQDKSLQHYIKYYYPFKHKEEYDKQKRWMKDKLWLLLQDKTFEESIKMLTDLGY